LPENCFHPILVKVGMMLQVDETFTAMWLSGSSRVKVRRWPQSPIGTIFWVATIFLPRVSPLRPQIWPFLPYFCLYSPAIGTRWYKWTF